MSPLLSALLTLVPLALPVPQGVVQLERYVAPEPSPSFTQRTLPLAGKPKAIVAAPLDGDPFPDLALLTWEPPTFSFRTHLATYRGQAGGKLVLAWESDLGSPGLGHAMRAFDVNADGWVDLSVPGMASVGALRPGDGTLVFDEAVPVPNVGGLVLDLTFADFTGDGLLDSLTAVLDLGGYFLDTGVNVGGLSFAMGSSAPLLPVDTLHPHIFCADLDGDGVTSHVVSSSTTGLSTFVFGVWPPQVTVFPGVYGEVAAADLDGDLDLDLVATLPLRGLTRVFENDGSGALAPSASFKTGLLPGHVALADFDVDGSVDVLVTNQGSGTLAMLAGDGTGGLDLLAPIPVGGAPTDVEAVDLDLDGDVDLVVIDETERTLSILLNELVP